MGNRKILQKPEIDGKEWDEENIEEDEEKESKKGNVWKDIVKKFGECIPVFKTISETRENKSIRDLPQVRVRVSEADWAFFMRMYEANKTVFSTKQEFFHDLIQKGARLDNQIFMNNGDYYHKVGYAQLALLDKENADLQFEDDFVVKVGEKVRFARNRGISEKEFRKDIELFINASFENGLDRRRIKEIMHAIWNGESPSKFLHKPTPGNPGKKKNKEDSGLFPISYLNKQENG